MENPLIVTEIVATLLELDQGADAYFVRNNHDQLVYIVGYRSDKRVCTAMPTAIDKRELEQPQGEEQA